jgi:hypothetical protein
MAIHFKLYELLRVKGPEIHSLNYTLGDLYMPHKSFRVKCHLVYEIESKLARFIMKRKWKHNWYKNGDKIDMDSI